MTKRQIVHGGRIYGSRTENGPLEEVPAGELQQDIDHWICRRVGDYPGCTVPRGGQIGRCTRCDARIVFNPARNVTAPKICMQCARIKPLPFQQ